MRNEKSLNSKKKIRRANAHRVERVVGRQFSENDFIAMIAWFGTKHKYNGFTNSINANYNKAIDVFNEWCDRD